MVSNKSSADGVLPPRPDPAARLMDLVHGIEILYSLLVIRLCRFHLALISGLSCFPYGFLLSFLRTGS